MAGAVLINRLPGAVGRLGHTTFAVMDAYPLDPAKVEVVFVRKDLLKLLTGKTFRNDQANVFVQQNLLLTLDPKEGKPGAPPRKVYVDRQADPLNISLVGNLGSGRAVYVGDRFNVKGIGKTVLATSQDPLRSNGVLDLVGSLWEMICSNVLHTNLQTGASPTLAVVDLNKDITVPWFQDPIPSGMIIRLDLNGELDRPSHLFFREQPVRAQQMHHMAACFGAQDAEKFIERIIHGGWSAGNISIHGSLIDYDSVFALRGRAPQWSFRPNWLSNFFGLEEQGQKELLKALAHHPINVDRVPHETLFRVFDDTKRSRLERRFLDLVGLEPHDAAVLADRQTSVISTLVTQFQNLSRKMYPNFRATAPWDEENAALSVYDLSRFFRLYPIAVAAGPIDGKTALSLIRNPLGKLTCSQETKEGGMPDSVMKPLLAEFGVSTPGQLSETDQLALEFIRTYEQLFAIMAKDWGSIPKSLCPRAYVVNEERTYMNSRPGHDTLIALLQQYKSGNIRAHQFSELLQLIIEACDRIPRPDSQGRFQADLCLSLNGYTSNLLCPNQEYQPRLTFLRAMMPSGAPPANGAWTAEIDGETFPCTIEEKTDRVHVVGPRKPVSRLLSTPPAPRFFHEGEPIRLQPLSRLDRPSSAI
jgi:hypothetical protein